MKVESVCLSVYDIIYIYLSEVFVQIFLLLMAQLQLSLPPQCSYRLCMAAKTLQ